MVARSSLIPRRRCPFPECPSHGLTRPKGVVRHGFMKSRHGARLRLLCRTCGRTFCSRKGSAYYRLQHPRAKFDQFARLASEGLSCAALARTLDLTPGTISRWLARAGAHARAFGDEHDKVEGAPLELQLDELCSGPSTKPGMPWIFNAIKVGSRFWVAGEVGRRTRGSTRAFVQKTRKACATLTEGVLISSDPFPYYEREVQRAFGELCAYVQVQNRYRQDWVVRSDASVILGTPEQAAELLERSEDSNRTNTAFVERLHLFLRRSCSYLHRRASGRVRNPARLGSVVDIIRCGYNFVRPHQALRFGKVTRTPAMQAGAFSRPLSWREIFAWPIHPGRRTHSLSHAFLRRGGHWRRAPGKGFGPNRSGVQERT